MISSDDIDINALEQAYIEKTGGLALPSMWKTVLDNAPEYFPYILFNLSYPWENGSLTPKERELILIVVNAAISTLSVDGLKTHIPRALEFGASKAEILAALHLSSGVGFHTFSTNAPGFIRVMEERNLLDEESESAFELLKANFEGKPTLAPMAAFYRMDPEYAASLIDSFRRNNNLKVLSDRLIELMIIGYDSSCTLMMTSGAEIHIEAALDAGATRQDIIETLILTSSISHQSMAVGVPILAEALKKAGIE